MSAAMPIPEPPDILRTGADLVTTTDTERDGSASSSVGIGVPRIGVKREARACAREGNPDRTITDSGVEVPGQAARPPRREVTAPERGLVVDPDPAEVPGSVGEGQAHDGPAVDGVMVPPGAARVRAAATRARQAVPPMRPPNIWSQPRPSLREVWRWSVYGQWAGSTGLARRAGQLYGAAVAVPVTTAAYYTAWMVEHPSRLAGGLLGVALAWLTPVGAFLLGLLLGLIRLVTPL